LFMDAEAVLQLLRSEIERAGGRMAFSKRAYARATVHRTLERQGGFSSKIINALDPGIAIVQLEEGWPLLLVNGEPVRAHRAQVALLICLCDELGRVVPYERLCRVIGHQSSGERQMHILAQHMLLVRRLLTKHKARCSLAVVAGVGYALCGVAQG
jgi:DNA-binding response OmpR family regulator